jgi:hypothetical protein
VGRDHVTFRNRRADLRPPSWQPIRISRQGCRSCRGQKDRCCGAARDAAHPRHVSARSAGTACLGFCQGTTARLAGSEPPKYADEEKPFEELKARLAKTIEFIKSLDQSVISAAADKGITFPAGWGTQRTLKGKDYLVLSGLPNFYFHVTTAYNILRHCGVELGKRDFLGPPGSS